MGVTVGVDATGAPETMMDVVAAEVMAAAADGMNARQHATFLVIAGDLAPAVPALSHLFRMIRVPIGMAVTGGQAPAMAATAGAIGMAVEAAAAEAPALAPAS